MPHRLYPFALALLLFTLVALPARADDILASGSRNGQRIAVELKLTPLLGTLPPGFDPDAFHQLAQRAIVAGFEYLDAHDAEAPSAELYFTFDFHPWLGEDGQLYLTSALFSEFDCVHPMYRRDSDPCAGPWEHQVDVFAAAARDLEAVLWDRIDEVDPAAGQCTVGETPPPGDSSHG